MVGSNSTQHTVLITGGASGLGLALAKAYQQRGWQVLIVDLDDAKTQAAAASLGQGVYARVCDVRDEQQLIAARDWMLAQWGHVDCVVNNAGVSVAGNIEDVSLDDWQWIIDINLLGVVRGCKVFTPVFKKQRSGRFINIASMAGLIHPPQMAAYNATKAAVVAVSETIKAELFNHQVDVHVVCPAFFRTNLADSQRSANSEIDAFTRKLITRAKKSADDVAELILQAVDKNRFHILTHEPERRIWLFKRLVPYAVYFDQVKKQVNKVMVRRKKAA